MAKVYNIAEYQKTKNIPEHFNGTFQEVKKGLEKAGWSDLDTRCAAELLRALYYFVNIDDELYIYNPYEGIYTLDDNRIYETIYKHFEITRPAVIGSIKTHLAQLSTRVERTHNDDLIVLGNGIFNKQTRKLESFRPDYIFTSKISGCYIEDWAKAVVKYPDFDAIKWFESGVDKDTIPTLWQMMYAVIDNKKNRRKCLVLYGEGKSGKSTKLDVLIKIAGEDNNAGLNLRQIGQKFLTKRLAGKSLCAGDDNTNSSFENSDIFKTVVSRGPMVAEIKNKGEVGFVPECTVVQCTNDPVRSIDKNKAIQDRLLIIEVKRPENFVLNQNIKEVYLKDQDVINGLMTYCLLYTEDFFVYHESEAIKEMAHDNTLSNDHIEEFLGEVIQYLPIGYLPKKRLYEAYTAWTKVRGYRPVTIRTITDKMLAKGIEKPKYVREWLGGENLTGLFNECNLKVSELSELNNREYCFNITGEWRK